MKIKEYINSKPKLKKTLKILAVIGVIFSVGFNILIIGVGSCSIHNNKDDSNDIIEPIATTPVTKNMGISYQNGIELYFSVSDFYSGDYLVMLINGLAEDYPYMAFNYNAERSVSFNDISGVIFPVVDGDVRNNVYKYVRNVIISKTGYTLRTNDSNLQYYTCTYNVFLLDANDQYIVSFWYACSVPLFDELNRDLGVQVRAVGYNPYGDSFISSLDWIYKEDNVYASGPYINYLYYNLYNSYYDKGYEDGYNVGFSDGDTYGYHNGYDRGYADGNAATTNTPFTLIKSAFNSLVGILNINLLPGISLAAIIFTPLIITIIIVIVKMFRG